VVISPTAVREPGGQSGGPVDYEALFDCRGDGGRRNELNDRADSAHAVAGPAAVREPGEQPGGPVDYEAMFDCVVNGSGDCEPIEQHGDCADGRTAVGPAPGGQPDVVMGYGDALEAESGGSGRVNVGDDGGYDEHGGGGEDDEDDDSDDSEDDDDAVAGDYDGDESADEAASDVDVFFAAEYMDEHDSDTDMPEYAGMLGEQSDVAWVRPDAGVPRKRRGKHRRQSMPRQTSRERMDHQGRRKSQLPDEMSGAPAPSNSQYMETSEPVSPLPGPSSRPGLTPTTGGPLNGKLPNGRPAMPKQKQKQSKESRGEVQLDEFLASLRNGDPDAPATKRDWRSIAELLNKAIAYLRQLAATREGPEHTGNCDTDQGEKRTRCEVQYRNYRVILRHAEIRKHALELLRRDSNADNIPVVTREQAEQYGRTRRDEDGPTADAFALDFNGQLGSPWNMRAKVVFAESFVQGGYSTKNKVEVQRLFKVHLSTLRRQFKSIMLDPSYEPTAAEIDAIKAVLRTARKRELRKRRRSACAQVSGLRVFFNYWTFIPYTAMSGDESDRASFGKRFFVTNLSWRSHEFQEFLVALDPAHLSTRWTAKGTWSKGNFPHFRERGSGRPDRYDAPVPGLPRNCYDDEWLENQRKREPEAYDKLDVQDPVDLTIPDDVKRIAERFGHCRTRSDKPLLSPSR